ncbi:Methyl sulfide methyltransferase-associated sensor [Candidatus Anstonella stagnisolia]|nr:Methyl sulfide methyltransferase-associated sensor [Candidatus Anstonella stagnisolia]
MKLQTRALLFLIIPLILLALYQYNSYSIVIGQVQAQVQLAEARQHNTDLAINVRYLTLLNARGNNLAVIYLASGNYTSAQKEISILYDLKRQRLEAFATLKSNLLSQNDSAETAQILKFEKTLMTADAKDTEILALIAALPKTDAEQQLIVDKKTEELDHLEDNLLADVSGIISSNFAAAQAANQQTSISLQNGLNALHVFSITTFIVVLIIVFFLNSLTINSISKISSAVEAVTKGKFDVELEQSNIYEIQALTNSFNRVLASMKLAILRTGMSKEDMGIGEALRAKKEAEDRYLSLFNSINEAIMVNKMTPKGPGNFVDVNDYACQLFGYSREEMLQMGPADLDKSIGQNEKTKGTIKALLSGSHVLYQMHQQSKDGRKLLMSISMRMVEIGGEKYIISAGRDISGAKELEDKYRALYESSSDAIMTLEPPSWNFTAGNPATIKLFGTKDEKEFTSLTPGDLSPKYQPDGQLSSVKSKKMIEKAMKEGSNLFEWTHRKYKGENFPATVLLTKMSIGGKDVLQATVREISDLKKKEEELKYQKAFSETILNSLIEGIDIVDEKLRIVYMNPVFIKIFGRQAIGKKCYAVYKDNKRQCEGCPLKKPIKIGETRAITTSGVAGGNAFEITHTGIMLPNGKKGVLEVFRNLGKKTEGAAHKSTPSHKKKGK